MSFENKTVDAQTCFWVFNLLLSQVSLWRYSHYSVPALYTLLVMFFFLRETDGLIDVPILNYVLFATHDWEG